MNWGFLTIECVWRESHGHMVQDLFHRLFKNGCVEMKMVKVKNTV